MCMHIYISIYVHVCIFCQPALIAKTGSTELEVSQGVSLFCVHEALCLEDTWVCNKACSKAHNVIPHQNDSCEGPPQLLKSSVCFSVNTPSVPQMTSRRKGVYAVPTAFNNRLRPEQDAIHFCSRVCKAALPPGVCGPSGQGT